MSVLKILHDDADCFREGIVIEVVEMPNVDGRYIIRYQEPQTNIISGIFHAIFKQNIKEITNIPKMGIGWIEKPRPDGNIAFVLLMNESGKSPHLDDIKLLSIDAMNKLNEQTKIMAIREKRQSTQERKVSENALSIVNESREILDAWEKKKTNPNDMRPGFRNNYI